MRVALRGCANCADHLRLVDLKYTSDSVPLTILTSVLGGMPPRRRSTSARSSQAASIQGARQPSASSVRNRLRRQSKADKAQQYRNAQAAERDAHELSPTEQVRVF